jgi:hypothetical protein
MADATTPAPVPPQGTQAAPPNPINPVTGQEDVLANQPPTDRPDDFKPVAAPDHDPVTGNPFPQKKFEKGPGGEIQKVQEPTDEVPHVAPPKPNKYPLSSAPVDPNASPAAKTTQSIQ